MTIARVITETVLGRQKLAFDEHAIQRMIERNVTEVEVIDTLNHPEVTGLRADPGRLRVRKRYGAESVDVVYEEEPTRIVVISVARNVKK